MHSPNPKYEELVKGMRDEIRDLRAAIARKENEGEINPKISPYHNRKEAAEERIEEMRAEVEKNLECLRMAGASA
jgi:hypothetical protein